MIAGDGYKNGKVIGFGRRGVGGGFDVSWDMA